MKHPSRPKEARPELVKKLEQLYQNYGIDVSNMDEDELERLAEMYAKSGRSLDSDLQDSEKHKDKFSEDII